MNARSATSDDVPAITELCHRYDTVWFGGPELAEGELRERFGRIEHPGRDTRLLFDGERLVGTVLCWRVDTMLVIDPDLDPAGHYDDLIGWLVGRGATVEALDRDVRLRDTLVGHGWRYDHSSFDLIRPVSEDWELPAAHWRAGVQLREYRPQDAAAVHHLIYVDAGFAEVAGHEYRDFDEWHAMFLAGRSAADAPVLAWRDDRLVGAAVGQLFDDGTGWIAQLATAKDARGAGIGRALILETFRRRRAAGATSLGLGVMADNRTALRLYLDVGLRVDREWQLFTPPAS